MSEILQSPFWAEAQETAGRRVVYIENCLTIKHALPLGKGWLYSPRPIIKSEEQWNALLSQVTAIAKQEKAIFWKIEGVPKLLITGKHSYSKCKIQNSAPVQYPETFIIDLFQTEEELLKNMKPKTRYNIALARKRGVAVQWSKNINDIDVFYDLLTETSRRQKIGIHSKKHYENIIKILGEHNAGAIIFAHHNNKPIAANLVTFYGDVAAYLHGGTDSRYRAFMAPYLLQWETIQEAKRRGLIRYDLGGCAVTKGKIEKWAGITQFKEGFGGTLTDMGETYDVVFNRTWYALYKNASRFKALIS